MTIYLKYFQKRKNVGDQFSKILANYFFKEELIISCQEEAIERTNLLLVGSIADWCDSYSYICGSGLISSQSKLRYKPKKIYSIRGPLTAHFLSQQGIAPPLIYGDPGILAPLIYPPKKNKPTYSIGVIPHYIDMDSQWLKQHQQEEEVLIINPLQNFDTFSTQIQQCERILSSSLHGLIFAHAYKKPALWIELSNKVIGNGFKFYDYYLSLNLSPETVVRYKVNSDDTPNKMCKYVTIGNHDHLYPKLLTTLSQVQKDFTNETK